MVLTWPLTAHWKNISKVMGKTRPKQDNNKKRAHQDSL